MTLEQASLPVVGRCGEQRTVSRCSRWLVSSSYSSSSSWRCFFSRKSWFVALTFQRDLALAPVRYSFCPLYSFRRHHCTWPNIFSADCFDGVSRVFKKSLVQLAIFSATQLRVAARSFWCRKLASVAQNCIVSNIGTECWSQWRVLGISIASDIRDVWEVSTIYQNVVDLRFRLFWRPKGVPMYEALLDPKVYRNWILTN